MKIRLLSSAVGIALAVGLIILSAYFSLVANLSLTAIAVMCVIEGLSAKGLNKKLSIFIPCIAFTALFCAVGGTLAHATEVFLFVTVIFMAMIINHENLKFPDLAYAFTVTALCTWGLWSVIYTFNSSVVYIDNKEYTVTGLFYIVTALATPWLADGGAYFGGSFFGKRKLCPKISPKKTVEGAVSGVFIGTLLSLLVGIIFQSFFFKNGEVVNYVYLAIFGLMGSLISIVGDLSFSLIKRSVGIKDYGSLIPGHGGMLDRFDSVIFTSPLLMIFNMILPIIHNAG